METSNCKNCGDEFTFRPSQSKGIYCTNKCQGQYSVKRRLTEDSAYNSGIRRYINDMYDCCSSCGKGREHNGHPLVLQVDHINGNTRDNRLENLRLLCPNCHSQTETWGVNNASDEGRRRMIENNRTNGELKRIGSVVG